MKKLLLLFVCIFALLSCEVKNSYQEPETGKDFSLVDEISVSVNTTENTRCLLYVGDPYVDGYLVGEPILIGYAPFTETVRIPKATDKLYLLMNGQMYTYSKGDIVVNKGVTRAESELSDALITAINNFYPEGIRNTPSDCYTECSDLIVGNEETEVWITYVGNGGAHLNNSLYYYTYTDDVNDYRDLDMKLVFDGTQTIGSKIALGKFTDCKIGFACSYSSGLYRYSTPRFNLGHNDILLTSGVIRTLVFGGKEYQTLGMEDQIPSGWFDQDYNDLLCLIESTPTLKPEIEIPVPELDPSKIVWQGMWLFEDNYPSQGDYDFNDVVVRFRIEESANIKNEVLAYIQVMATGANFNNSLGINGKIYVENLTGYMNVRKGTSRVETEVIQITLPKASEYIPMLNNGKAIFDLNSYNVHSADFPNVLEIPSVDFKWCLENIRIDEAYPMYTKWVDSGCKSYTDWYKGERKDDMVYME